MAQADNQAIARRFIQAWNAGNHAVVDELAAPDLRVAYSHFPAPLESAAAFKAMLTQTWASFPDLHIQAHEPIVAGDQVTVQWSYDATHQHGELFGIPATGKPVHVNGITIYHIEGGKVVEEQGIVDNLSLLLQLSALAT